MHCNAMHCFRNATLHAVRMQAKKKRIRDYLLTDHTEFLMKDPYNRRERRLKHAAMTSESGCAVGWPDIGYNFLVGEDGRAYEGRGWDEIGAHTYGYNDNAVAVSVMGTYTSVVPGTAAQNALKNVFDCAVQQVRLV